MSIMDELKKLTRPYDDDSALIDDDPDLDVDVDEPAYARPTEAAPVAPAPDPVMSMGTAPSMGASGAMPTGMGVGMGNIPSASSAPINMGGVSNNSKDRVVLVKPEEFDAATVIAKHICQGATVILNCEDTDEKVARRVIDFLSGCAFALDGSIKKASSNVIIIAPKDVGVDDAKTGEQRNA